MKTRRVLVAVIEKNRVVRITMADWWFYKDPMRPVEMVDISSLETRPEIGWGYAKGIFFTTSDQQMMFRIRARTLK